MSLWRDNYHLENDYDSNTKLSRISKPYINDETELKISCKPYFEFILHVLQKWDHLSLTLCCFKYCFLILKSNIIYLMQIKLLWFLISYYYLQFIFFFSAYYKISALFKYRQTAWKFLLKKLLRTNSLCNSYCKLHQLDLRLLIIFSIFFQTLHLYLYHVTIVYYIYKRG